ncbi:MAG: carboxyl transferase domain-containing protein, partial [Acidimicrobiales bacterium]
MTSDHLIVLAPLEGTVISVDIEVGQLVSAGQQLFVIESMKMEHVIASESGGRVASISVASGDTVARGASLAPVAAVEGAVAQEELVGNNSEPAEAARSHDRAAGDDARPDIRSDLTDIRSDLAEVQARHEVGHDDRRPDAVARRRRTAQRTARENIAAVCDPGTFVEYGPLAIAAQRRRREVSELIEKTPADGLVGGLGTVHGHRVVLASYDYTVLAGTQGFQNHRKKDRLFELAKRLRLPVVLFAEGGGGRPGDIDSPGVSGLDTMAFRLFAELSGLVPLIWITAGRCFAGNAA